jgi:hypothetical protein
MVKILILKVAVTEAAAFIVNVQDGEVPLQAPDQPTKVEPVFGVAVSLTTVPGLNVEPVGLFVTIPLPVPALLMVRPYREEEVPDWFTVKTRPAMVKVPVLEDEAELADTEK